MKMEVEMEEEGMIREEEEVLSIEKEEIEKIMNKKIDKREESKVVGMGMKDQKGDENGEIVLR